MLEVSITVLLIAWVLGLMSAYTLGGAIHLLAVLALVLLAIRLVSGGRPSQRRDVSRR
jgi:uncharacterized protein (DUF58 family)